jgi:hypothetical protein
VICPYCGSKNVQCDEVDIGVGMQQCGPYGCDECHAVEISPQLSESERAALTEEERRTGWRR